MEKVTFTMCGGTGHGSWNQAEPSRDTTLPLEHTWKQEYHHKKNWYDVWLYLIFSEAFKMFLDITAPIGPIWKVEDHFPKQLGVRRVVNFKAVFHYEGGQLDKMDARFGI